MINKPKFPPKPSYTPDPKIMKAIKEKEDRKEIAVKIFCALASNPHTWEEWDWDRVIKESVNLADELIEELNKSTNDKP